jgi:hypothetical protein
MNLLYALPLLLVLLCALFLVRRVIRRSGLRRQKSRRGRSGRPSPKSFIPLGTKRSQMRTDDDPTTVMERITESKPPTDLSRKSGK